jgi:hypothetical protein
VDYVIKVSDALATAASTKRRSTAFRARGRNTMTTGLSGCSAQRTFRTQVYEKAVAAEDFDTAAILVSEGVGLIRDIRPAADIVREMVDDATRGAQYSGDQADVRSNRLSH